MLEVMKSSSSLFPRKDLVDHRPQLVDGERPVHRLEGFA